MAEEKKRYIRVQGELVEVSKAVYLAYYRMARRARGADEKDQYNGTILFSDLNTKELRAIETFQDPCIDSVETTAIHSLMSEKLHRCLKLLSDDESSLIHRRYWDQASQSEVAAELKTSQQVISYREKQILGKLKKLLEK